MPLPDLSKYATALNGADPDPAPSGPPCGRCGQPMPPLPDELAAMARANPGVQLTHDVCPGETPAAPTGRYFEVRVSVVEVTESNPGPFGDGVDGGPEHAVPIDVEMISFVAGYRAPDLDAAMRPLALALGQRWEKAERQAKIADSGATP